MAKLNPFIRFNGGKCAEAMNFYKGIIGGELYFMPVKGSVMEKDMPADKQDLIMHSSLTKDTWTLIGSDMMRDTATIGDHMGVAYEAETVEEGQGVFAKLSEGGEIFMPFEKQFWGTMFGLVTDKYGVEWMVTCIKTI